MKGLGGFCNRAVQVPPMKGPFSPFVGNKDIPELLMKGGLDIFGSILRRCVEYDSDRA